MWSPDTFFRRDAHGSVKPRPTCPDPIFGRRLAESAAWE